MPDAVSLRPTSLATRLVAAVTVLVLCLVALLEASQVRGELSAFEKNVDRNHWQVAHVLADAAAAAVARDGVETAAELVRREAGRQAPENGVRWVCVPGRVDDPPAALACPVATNGLHQFATPDTEGRRTTLLGVRVAGGPLGAIEVTELQANQDALLHRRVVEEILQGLVLVFAAAAAAIFLGMRYVAAPTRRLVDKARAVGRGEFDPPLALLTGDEFETLANELNAMVEQLRTSRDAVARETEARVRALEQLRHADRLATVGHIATGLAHELGTPLNVVEARADLLLSDPSLDEPARDSLRVIQSSTERMARLVRQLLLFARQRRLESHAVDLTHVATQVADMLRPLAARRQVAIRVVGAPAPVLVRADEVLLQQAVTNLVVNGIHAAPTAGHVTLEVSSDHAQARLTVRDDGGGVAPENRRRIFEPFFTTKSPGEGTGLGLAVAWDIVAEHGGELRLRDEAGPGAIFDVLLPREVLP